MQRVWPIALLLLFTGGCATTGTEPDCGMYDFDCKDAPQGDALIEPGNNVAGAARPQTHASAASSQTAPAADLEARVRRLEAEVKRLRQRLDAME